MKRFITIAFYASTLFWVCFVAWSFLPEEAPIVSAPGDSIQPLIVKVGGVITISRNLHVKREAPVFVQRTLVRGDCAKSCEIVDLPSGNITLPAATYGNLLRDHKLPTVVEPGDWTAVFTIQWTDRLGRTHYEPLMPLAFKVTP